MMLVFSVYFLVCFFAKFKYSEHDAYFYFDCCLKTFLFSLIPYVLALCRCKTTKTLQAYYIIMLMGHYIGGDLLDLYAKVPWYNFVLHFLNSVLIGFIIYNLLKKYVQTKNKFLMAILIVACVLMVGILWEIYEWLADGWWNRNMQRHRISAGVNAGQPFMGRQALMDTMEDICLDIFGGVATAICVLVIKVKHTPIDEFFAISYVKRKIGEAKDITEESKNSQQIEKSKNNDASIQTKLDNNIDLEENNEL